MHRRLSFLILIALIAAAIPPASSANRQQKPQSGKPQQPPPKQRERVVIETHFVTVNVKLNAPKQMRRLTLSYRKGYPAF